MTHPIGTVVVRRQRGKLIVEGQGRTPRGQKFIANQVELADHDMADPKFKDDLKAAVDKLFA